jgi:hypothetical protein
LDVVLALTAQVFANASAAEEEDDNENDNEDEDSGRAGALGVRQVEKRLRALCLRRVCDMLAKFQGAAPACRTALAAAVPRMLLTLRARIERLPVENTQSPVGLHLPPLPPPFVLIGHAASFTPY